MESQHKCIASYYDSESADYASKYKDEIESKPFDQYILQRFISFLNTNDKVCEIGCGPAQVTKYVRNLKQLHYLGLDLSCLMLREGAHLNENVPFINSNMMSMPFRDQTLNGIIAFYAIVHNTNEDLKNIITEIHRVLKQKGVLVISYHIGDDIITVKKDSIDISYFFHDYESVDKILSECGFKYIESVARKPYIGTEYPSNRGYVLAMKT